MYINFSFARVALVHSPCVRYALLFLGRCRLLPCNCYRCWWWWFWSARWSAVLSINSGWGRLMRTPSVTGEQDHVRCWCVNTQRASRTSSGKTEYEKTKRITIADNRCSVQSWQFKIDSGPISSTLNASHRGIQTSLAHCFKNPAGGALTPRPSLGQCFCH